MIFQEPMTSLNPVFTCGDQVAEAIRVHRKISAAEARQQTISLFAKVELPDPEGMYSRWPHQLSGGQKQRVMIAMAMSSRPSRSTHLRRAHYGARCDVVQKTAPFN